jgi:pimeloyl-ACP methyl ester carboxylesterase
MAARLKQMEEAKANPTAARPPRIYPTLEAALLRFRLMPPQPAGNPFIADFIARRSLKRTPMPDGSGEGWTWCFDPSMWAKLQRGEMMSMMNGDAPAKGFKVPIVHIYGDRSRIIDMRTDRKQPAFMAGIPEIEIADSHHHVMIDQPLALVAAIRALLAVWAT